MVKRVTRKIKQYLIIATFLSALGGCVNTNNHELVSTNKEVSSDQAATQVQAATQDPETFEASIDKILATHDEEWIEKYEKIEENSNQSLSEEWSEHLYAHRVEYSDENVDSQNTEVEKTVPLKKSKLLETLISEDWSEKSAADIATNQQLTYRLYKVDEDAGISVKVLNGKVFNLVFTKNYNDEIIAGITLDSSKEDVIKLLGTPNFLNSKAEIFGYVDQDIYVFFLGNEDISEISIYRNDVKKGHDRILKVLDQWRNDSTSVLSNLLEEDALEYDWSGGVSAVSFFGYESKGLIIKYDQASDQIQLDVFSNAREALSEDLRSRMLDGINLIDRDAIFDLEQYRVILNNEIQGEVNDTNYDLGMAFENENSFVLSPNKQFGFYYKMATIDDNYACIYITNMLTQEPYDELVVDIMGAQISWINDGYIICKGTEVSYLYDVVNRRVIPLPSSIFGLEFTIVAIEEGKIIYTKVE